MNIADIRESGLLELYVLNEVSADDRRIVLAAIEKYPELKRDIQEIEYSLEQYAKVHAVVPSSDIKAKLLQNLDPPPVPQNTSKSDGTNNRRSFFGPFITALIIGSGSIAALFFTRNEMQQLNAQYESDKILCDSLQLVEQQRQEIFAGITDPNSKILVGDATENYEETVLYIHHNPSSGKNYLQIKELPDIAINQSYQLWSLKDGVDPIPLDVFQGSDSLFEIQFEENTNAYAITIEPLGGQSSPTLERLITIIPVS